MKVKTAREVMTPLEDAYMLEESCKLSFAVVRDIFDHGFSRVPVYARERQHVVGLLFVKDLIFVDPEDEVPLAEYLRVFERSIELVDAESNLDDVLRIFKRGRGHLALVLGCPRKSSLVEADCLSPLHGSDKSFIVGLVTLEDIIEEILGDEQCINQLSRRVSATAESWPSRHRREVSTTAWRCGLSPIDSASTAALSPRNDFVKNSRVPPTHCLICAQATRSSTRPMYMWTWIITSRSTADPNSSAPAP